MASGAGKWFDKLLHVKQVEPATEAHSKALTNKEVVYEMQGKQLAHALDQWEDLFENTQNTARCFGKVSFVSIPEWL